MSTFLARLIIGVPAALLIGCLAYLAYVTLQDLNHDSLLSAVIGGLIVAHFMGKKNDA